MTASSPTSSSKGPLDAAQKIVAELQGVTPEHQSLAIKFAMETLGINLPSPAPHLTPVTPAATHLPGIALPAHGGGHSTDIKSFTAMKAPKSDQQFVAVVAYFYQFEAPLGHRKDRVDSATMKDAARLAVWKQPNNWNTTLNNAQRSGYLDRAEPGFFKLSSVGENLVAITLPDSTSSPASGRRPKAKKIPAKASKKAISKKASR